MGTQEELQELQVGRGEVVLGGGSHLGEVPGQDGSVTGQQDSDSGAARMA